MICFTHDLSDLWSFWPAKFLICDLFWPVTFLNCDLFDLDYWFCYCCLTPPPTMQSCWQKFAGNPILHSAAHVSLQPLEPADQLAVVLCGQDQAAHTQEQVQILKIRNHFTGSRLERPDYCPAGELSCNTQLKSPLLSQQVRVITTCDTGSPCHGRHQQPHNAVLLDTVLPVH